jgi:hypothetical protein
MLKSLKKLSLNSGAHIGYFETAFKIAKIQRLAAGSAISRFSGSGEACFRLGIEDSFSEPLFSSAIATLSVALRQPTDAANLRAKRK